MLKKIVSTLGLLSLIVLMFFISLMYGIKIDDISFNNINIKQLYLKYDKKLIFTVKTLKITPTKDATKSEFDPSYIGLADDLLNSFKLIKIEDIIYDKEHIFVEFKDNIFILKHKEADAKITFTTDKQKLYINSTISLIKYGIEIDAKIDALTQSLTTDIKKPIIDIGANIKHKEFDLNLVSNIKNGYLNYKIDSNKITTLKFINQFTTLEDNIHNLINNQLKFNNIQLNLAKGKVDLEYPSKVNLNNISAKLTIEEPNLKYQTYPKLSFKKIYITLEDGKASVNIVKNYNNQHISFNGDIYVNINNENVNIDGALYYKDIQINTNSKIDDKTINYKISTNKFQDIKLFEEFIQFPPSIRKWAVERLVAKSVKIDNVSGKIYKKDFEVDFSSIRVDAQLNDIVMDFNPKKAYPLIAKKVTLNFDGKDMFISLDKPISNDVNLEGSDAVIYNMFDESGLMLNLQSISPINWTLVRAVQSYDVELPNQLGLRQTKGKSDIKVKIDIPFDDNPTDVYVKIINKNSTLNIKDNNVSFKKFDFLYKDNKVFIQNTDAVYDKYNIDISNLLFDIPKSELNLKLSAYDNNETFLLDLTNYTSLEQNITNGEINIKYVDINDTVNIKNELIPYSAKFGQNIEAKIPTLGIYYNQSDQNHHFKIDELTRFEDMIIPLKKANLLTANLYVNTKGTKNIDISVDAKSKNNDINQTYDIAIKSNINLDNNTSNGDIKINKLKFKNIVNLKNTNIPYHVVFKDRIKVELPSLMIDYTKDKKLNEIDIKSFDQLNSLIIPLKDYNLTNTSLNIQTEDFKDLIIRLKTDIEKYGIFYKNKKLKNIILNTNIKDMKDITVKDDKGMLNAIIILEEQPTINIDISHMGVEYKDDTNDTNRSVKKQNIEIVPEKCKFITLDLPIVTAKMNDGYFKYNSNLLKYDKIKVDTKKDIVKFNLDSNSTNILLNLKNNDINISGTKLNKIFINNIAGVKAIDDGNINFNILGTQCLVNGDIKLDNINIKEAKALNKIFLVINSAPALINPFLIIPNAYRFATDQFSLSEYKIKKGNIDFNLNRDTNIFNIRKLDAVGVHSDFSASGKIDLNKNKIDSKLDIIFMKDYASIIKHIPIIGYIILGDEKRFSYSVDINGKLNDPKISTHIAKESVVAPLNIIKRVITLPFLPFYDSNLTKEELETHNKIVEEFTN